MALADTGFHRVDELPERFHAVFPNFKLFNPVQSECFHHSFLSDLNMVIAAPTGSGKTVVLELAMLRLFMRHMLSSGEWILQPGRHKCIYVAPNKSLVQERVADWTARMAHLGLQIIECTGDSDGLDSPDLGTADIIATTPEKLDALSRRFFDSSNGGMSFISDVALLLVDEVHMLSEDRGPTLEAGVVCRLRTLGSMRELASTNLSSMRILAASATIPNVHDIARWLRVDQDGCKIFGDEMRPVSIRTIVKGYPAAKNDFLFEKWLSDKVFSIVQEHWQNKPVLTFCSSRKGTVECANQVRKASMRLNTRTVSFFVRNEAQKARLIAAAQNTHDKALADMLVNGIAWHNASMEPADRSLVEQLFISRDIMFLACTATLAQGVNLPAYLVIVKGTQRYCSDGGMGRACQYREYEMGECLQMIGRAGRPQFESSAVAVFMTKAENSQRYQNLTQGRAAIESQLHKSLAEFLNAAIAQRIVCSVTQAHAWLQSTYLWQRLFINPSAYGIVIPQSTPESLAKQAKHLFIDVSLQRLASAGLISIVRDAISPLDPGSLMCKHSIQLGTMALIHSAPETTSLRDLLQIVCSASENSDIPLRRSEKKVLNDLNSQAHTQAASNPGSALSVLEDIDSNKKKQRVSEPWEKSFVLVNNCLMSGGDFAPSVDFSMRQDANKVIQSGKRIVQCMIRYYEFAKRFAAIAAAIRLHRALVQKMWDAYPVTVRQLPGVGKLLGDKLLEAGLGDIASMADADPRHVEKVTNKVYPWGDQKREEARRLLPPKCQLNIDLSGTISSKVFATVSLQAAKSPGQNRRLFSWLVVGSLHDDRLLAAQHIDLNACPAPFQVTVSLMSKPLKGEQVRVVAAVMSANIIGRDCITPVSMEPSALVAHQAGATETAPVVAVATLANAPKPPRHQTVQGTGQHPVAPYIHINSQHGAMVGHNMLAMGASQTGTGNGMVMPGPRDANRCHSAPRPVVILPSFHAVGPLGDVRPAPHMAMPSHTSQCVRSSQGEQFPCTQTPQLRHVSAINGNLDAKSVQMVHPSGGLVGPKHTRRQFQAATGAHQTMDLAADSNDVQHQREPPKSPTTQPTPQQLGCDARAGKLCNNVPRLVSRSYPGQLDTTPQGTHSNQSTTGQPSSPGHRASFALPEAQGGESTTFTCNRFPTAEPSPEPVASRTEMSTMAKEQQSYVKPSKAVSMVTDVPCTGTRQGRLLQMMQRARMILHGQSQSTQGAAMSSSVSATQDRHLPILAKPEPKKAGKEQGAEPDAPAHSVYTTSHPMIDEQHNDAKIIMPSCEKRPPSDPQVRPANTASDIGDESIFRKAFRAAVQKTTRRLQAGQDRNQAWDQNSHPADTTSSGKLQRHFDDVCDQKQAQSHPEESSVWAQFETSAVEAKCSRAPIAGAWAHNQPPHRESPWQRRNTAVHGHLKAAAALKRTLHSDVLDHHASDGADLPQIPPGTHALHEQWPQECVDLHVEQSERAQMDSEGEGNICTAVALKGLLCKAKQPSPSAEHDVPSPVSDVPPARGNETCVSPSQSQRGPKQPVRTVDQATQPSLAEGNISTGTWICKQIYSPLQPRTATQTQGAASGLSDAMQCTDMVMPESVVLDRYPTATVIGGQVQPSDQCEQAPAAGLYQSSQDTKHVSSGEFTTREGCKKLTSSSSWKGACRLGRGDCLPKPVPHAKLVMSLSRGTDNRPGSENGGMHCGSLPATSHNPDCKEPAPVGRNIQSALGRLRKALCQSKQGQTCKASAQAEARLDSQYTESVAGAASLAGQSAACSEKPHNAVKDRELEAPMGIGKWDLGKEYSTPQTPSVLRAEVANETCELRTARVDHLLPSSPAANICSTPTAQAPTPEPSSPASPQRPTEATTVLPAPEPSPEVVASVVLPTAHHSPVTQGDALPNRSTSVPNPGDESVRHRQRLECDATSAAGAATRTRTREQGRAPVRGELPAVPELDAQQSSQPVVQEGDAPQQPHTGDVGLKRKFSASSHNGARRTETGSGPGRTQVARRPAFKCPRHRKAEGL